MKPTVEQIGNLLALKRHERPPEGYMEDFLREFHQRTRQEAVNPTGLKAWWSRFSEWVSEPEKTKWLYGGGLAYAAIALGFVLVPRSTEVAAPVLEPARYEVLPVVSEEPVPTPADKAESAPAADGSVEGGEF